MAGPQERELLGGEAYGINGRSGSSGEKGAIVRGHLALSRGQQSLLVCLFGEDIEWHG